MKNRHLTLSLAVALALASPCASAMGLGQLQVRSGLNQPLVAEIPIISATPSEIEKLDVRLASPEAFARVGLDLPAELSANLQFSVGKSSSGQPVIKITTPERFSEPFLSFLIEADWGKGTVTREYTALIDPPFIAPAVIQPMVTPAIAAAPAPVAPAVAPPVAAVPAPQPEVAQTSPATEPEPVEVAPTPAPPPVAAQPVEPSPEVQPSPQPKPRPVAPKPAPVQQASRPPAPKPAPVPAPAPAAAPGQVGPIAPGQALWSIANSVRPDPAISVNQMMVALLRANPQAFAGDNINRLKSGSVLRVPGQDEVNRVSDADAAILVSQQASAWRAPRAPMPQPAEGAAAPDVAAAAAAPKPAAPRVAGAGPAPSSSRLEIVPPSGNAKARGAQSGAAAGAGGSELRAELVQAREDLAARTSEVKELQSRISELQAQDADRQRLIEMQNSQLKELQDRLKQIEAQQATAPAGGATAAATPAPAEVAKPWYLSPFVIAAAVLILLGGLVLAMRRSKTAPQGGDAAAPRRLSDDEALRTSMARSREAGEKIKREPALAPVQVAEAVAQSPAPDSELDALTAIVVAHPQDLEAHLNLLRLHHARRNAAGYESAAQAMRLQVANTTDPRWREAVIMGASLLPGHVLFGQAGWNSPRFTDSDASARSATKAAPAVAAGSSVAQPALPESNSPPIRVFDSPDEFSLTGAEQAVMDGQEAASSKELDLDDQHKNIFGDSLANPPVDIHRNEAQVMVEDEASATRIDLARAYLDFGDLEGARSMLEEVLAEGGPSAKAEAARILKDMG